MVREREENRKGRGREKLNQVEKWEGGEGNHFIHPWTELKLCKVRCPCQINCYNLYKPVRQRRRCDLYMSRFFVFNLLINV